MRRISTAFTLAVLLMLGAVAVAGEFLSRPARRYIGAPPPELRAVSVHIPVTPNGFVAGWFTQGKVGAGAVLLLHGVRSDRTQMLGRALALHSAGYSVLLIDLPAHGESTGDRITFGVREGAGVEAALAYLRQELPTDYIGVIGVSLGAASLVLSHPSPAPDAVVLESMYPTISEAVKDRLEMRLGAWGARLAPLLLWQLHLRIGVHEEQLRPVEQLPKLQAPILIASGTNDLHTTWPETERIFAAAANPKELWSVPGATHVDLYAFAPAAYEAKVFGFLSRHLRSGPANPSVAARPNGGTANPRRGFGYPPPRGPAIPPLNPPHLER